MTTNTDRKRTSADTYNGGDTLDDHTERYLIEREVLACQSCLADSLLRVSGQTMASGHYSESPLPTWEDIENAYKLRCPDCGEVATEDYYDEETATDYLYGCESCGWYGDDADQEPQDIMEWWLVTPWLAEQLEERGQPTLTDGQSCWWGRCCTGQSILLDGIMQRIVVETGYCGWPEGRLATT